MHGDQEGLDPCAVETAQEEKVRSVDTLDDRPGTHLSVHSAPRLGGAWACLGAPYLFQTA